jgi:quercetin dioxygenase-like cupin family protein
MKQFRSSLFLVLAAVGGAATTFAWREAWATPSSGFTSVGLSGPTLFEEFSSKDETTDWGIKLQSRGQSDIYVTEITIIPGGHGGWHSHPGPSIISVKAGEATFYDDCDGAETPHVYPAGTGFVEDAGCVHIVRNEGDVDLKIYVMQIVPRGAARRTDENAPN